MNDESLVVDTPFDGGDLLAATAMHLDALQARCNEAIEQAKIAQAKLVATQQTLQQQFSRMRGLLVHAANKNKKRGTP